MIEYLKLFNFKIIRIFKISRFEKLKKKKQLNLTIGRIKKKNFTIWKINILQFEKLLNIFGIEIMS